MDVFDTPERRADGSYILRFSRPIDFGTELRWEKDAEFPTPDLRLQSQLNAFREKTVKDLSLNKVMFRTPPTLASLTAITPMWGILIHGGKPEWSRQDIWTKPSVKDHAHIVSLVAQGVVISRQSILPMWGVQVRKVLPDAQIIDLDFDGADVGDEGASVHSEDLASEEGVVALRDPTERKRVMKAHVRELLEKVAQAKMEADDAMDRFFSEFDLSEDESDFSDYEDE
jgi:hypothetical protein